MSFGVDTGDLERFAAESNRIEGIHRPPVPAEVSALESFLQLAGPARDDLVNLVGAFQPGAVLRDQPGLNVRVGSHYPPPGGPAITVRLDHVLRMARTAHPYVTHYAYETLHPFTDGNGRSGRALWLWGMRRDGQLDRALELGFLHLWYYQSLEYLEWRARDLS